MILLYLEIRGEERYAHLASKNSQRMVATLENFLNRSDVIDINRTSENS
jgi:hypothetical protein